MTAERSGRPQPRGAYVAAVGVLIAAIGVGWFALSHFVMDTAVADALGEAAGVVLGFLVVASVVGALTSSRGR